jgi:ubiquitin C-terminal hydrolase
LGATCYLNSVFQQILRIPAFQYLLLKEASQTDAVLFALQNLTTCLLKSKRQYGDTAIFCEVWRGWGNQPISLHEQQDAKEFLELLLDGLPPSVSSLFRGELSVKYSGIDDRSFVQENDESFF